MSSPSLATMLADARLILFDAVGTLIYPEPSVADVYFSLAEKFGSQLRKEEIAGRFRAALARNNLNETSDTAERLRWRQIVAEVVDDVPEIDPLFDRLWQHFAQGAHWRLYPDVLAAWPGLLTRGVPLGVASNFDRRLNLVLDDLQLPGLSYVYSSAEVGYSKPDGRFFKNIEQQTGRLPSEILLIGDDPVADCLGATLAGWRCILVQRDGNYAGPSQGAETGYVTILSLVELLGVCHDS